MPPNRHTLPPPGDGLKAAAESVLRAGALAAYMEPAGALLRTVHNVGLPPHGYIGDVRGMYEDFTGWLLGCDVEDGPRQVDGATAETLYPLIARKVGPAPRRYGSRFGPALVHGDRTPENALPTNDGGLVFVDWDDAVGGFRVGDYAALTCGADLLVFLHARGRRRSRRRGAGRGARRLLPR